MPAYHFMVTVETDTLTHAEQVMRERILYDEEVPDIDNPEELIEYTLDFGPLP